MVWIFYQVQELLHHRRGVNLFGKPDRVFPHWSILVAESLQHHVGAQLAECLQRPERMDAGLGSIGCSN